jgi:hypothetical protein
VGSRESSTRRFDAPAFRISDLEGGLLFCGRRGRPPSRAPRQKGPVAPAAQLYGELYAYRVKDGTMIRSTEKQGGRGSPSWEAPVGAK